ncbi:MAG: TonB-dependent receptor [Burkholderiales bacterium]
MNYKQHGDQFFPFPVVSDAVDVIAGLVPLGSIPIFPIPTPLGPIDNLRDATAAVAGVYDSDATEESVFGEVTRRLGERFELTAGGRYFHTVFVGDTLLRGLINVALVGSAETRGHAVIVERDFNPKFSIRYLHDENMQVYLLAAKGFQFGGVQLNPPTIAITALGSERAGFAFVPFKSSKLWNYELGLRTEWLDRRLKFDVTFFYLDWTDLQLTQSVEFLPGGLPPEVAENVPLSLALIGNVGAAHSEGVELALQAEPFDGLSFSTSAAFISALTDEVYESPSGPIAPGARLPGSPRFQLSNVVAYAHELPFWGLAGAASLAHTHTGSSFSTLSQAFESDAYDTLDLRLAVQRPEGRFVPELALNIVNLTNEFAVVEGFESGRIKTYLFNRPRTALLTLGLRF